MDLSTVPGKIKPLILLYSWRHRINLINHRLITRYQPVAGNIDTTFFSFLHMRTPFAIYYNTSKAEAVVWHCQHCIYELLIIYILKIDTKITLFAYFFCYNNKTSIEFKSFFSNWKLSDSEASKQTTLFASSKSIKKHLK